MPLNRLIKKYQEIQSGIFGVWSYHISCPTRRLSIRMILPQIWNPHPGSISRLLVQSRTGRSRFSLPETRYGEIHQGEAALYEFVTEKMKPNRSKRSIRGASSHPKIKCRQKIFHRHLSLFHYDLDLCAGGCPKLSAAA